MFSYICLSWHSGNDAQVAAARRFQDRLNAQPAWSSVFATSGQRVYAAGMRPGTHGICALPSGQGVVLGRLFRRSAGSDADTCDVKLTDGEGQAITESDGVALIQRFWGRWVAVLPSWTGMCRVLRDPTGALPCYRMEAEGVSIAFAWLEDVLELLRLPSPAVSWDGVAAMLAMRQLTAHETALQGVSQVLPGELTTLTPGTRQSQALWSAADVARRPADLEPDEAAARLRDTTLNCVRAWASCYDKIVLRLSGGFDSAVVLGALHRPRPATGVVCLNYFSDGADGDERSYARLAASRADCLLIERQRNGNFCLEEVLHPARTPIPSSYLGRMGSDPMDLQEAQAHGASALFTGAGGDQLFQEVRNTWSAADYLQLRGLDRGFPAATLDAARLGRVSFWRALHLAFRDRFARHDPIDGTGQFAALVTRDTCDAAMRMASRFVNPDLIGAGDLPIGKLNHLRALICPFDHQNPYTPRRPLDSVTPLMSQPLLEFCLSLPTYLLTRGGQGRALARKAFADQVPAEIAMRRSKGSTDDHATTVLLRNLPLVKEILLDGQLVRRGLVDKQRMESALAGRTSTHDAYIAEIHACVAMEAWLGSVQRSSQSTDR